MTTLTMTMTMQVARSAERMSASATTATAVAQTAGVWAQRCAAVNDAVTEISYQFILIRSYQFILINNLILN